MDFFVSALAWLFDPNNYLPDSQSPLPISDRLAEHLLYTVIAVSIASLIALPLGFYIGHTGRGRQLVIALTGGARAMPTLGLLMAFSVIFGFLLSFTVSGYAAAFTALIILAIPSTLAGAYSGIEAVDRVTVDAARANGMSEMQILTKVEIPLALPLIVGGIRASVLQVIATAVIASYIGLGGIGRIISSGIGLNDNDRILGGALLVTALALAVDGVLALVQLLVRPRGSGTSPSRRPLFLLRTTASHTPTLRQLAVGETTADERINLMSTSHKMARMAASAVAVGALFALTACATADPTGTATSKADASESVTVGSFAYPESEILAEIYSIALAEAGFDVETALNLGPRQATIPALEDGSIDLIPEYNGNLMFHYDTENQARTTEEVDAALADLVPEGFRVLDSSPAQDADAYVVTRATAEEFGLVEIGDLSALEPFTIGAYPQFSELGFGLPGLASVYGVTDVELLPIEDFGGPDTVRALLDDAVQVANIFTTSPAITAEDLVVLEDPKNLIAAQNVLPLLNADVYSDELAAVLNEVSAAMSTEELIALRERVEGDENVQAQVAAREWLEEKGLI